MEDLLQTLEDVVTFCEAQGADAEVFGIKIREIIITIERNDIKLSIEQYTTGIGIRTLIKHSLGFSACNSLRGDVVMETAENAVKMSRKTPPLAFAAIASPGTLPHIPGLYDSKIEDFDEEAAISSAERMIESARKDPRVSIDRGEFTAALEEKAVCTSSHISSAERKSRFSWVLIGLAREGREVSPLEHQYGFTTQTKELTVEESANQLTERILTTLHPQKSESFSGDLILGPEAVFTVIDPLIRSVNAKNVYLGQSALEEKIKEAIAPTILTIRDDPTVEGDFNSSQFDREGTPHQNLNIIEKGVLKNFLYDSQTANREDKASTGNAVGTFREMPRIGSTNLILEGGLHSVETMVEETRKGLLIRKFNGTVSQLTGDFSGAVKGAQFITSGEIQYPVKEAFISGNIFMILSKINDISRETMSYPGKILPYIKIPAMKILT